MMRVVVEPYNPLWAQQFQQIKGRLQTELSGQQYIGIEHVGSTSVPGLAAKPVIDVDIIVAREDVEDAIAVLRKAGYHYVGEGGIPDRHLIRPREPSIAQNLYICVENSQSLRNHLSVRNACRENTELREMYGKKKMQLAEQEWSSVDEYCEAKNEVVAFILLSQGMSKADVDQIKTFNTLFQ